jgi:hypothetical protein
MHGAGADDQDDRFAAAGAHMARGRLVGREVHVMPPAGLESLAPDVRHEPVDGAVVEQGRRRPFGMAQRHRHAVALHGADHRPVGAEGEALLRVRGDDRVQFGPRELRAGPRQGGQQCFHRHPPARVERNADAVRPVPQHEGQPLADLLAHDAAVTAARRIEGHRWDADRSGIPSRRCLPSSGAGCAAAPDADRPGRRRSR